MHRRVLIPALLAAAMLAITLGSSITTASASPPSAQDPLGTDCAAAGDVRFYGNWECGANLPDSNTDELIAQWKLLNAPTRDDGFVRQTGGARQGLYSARFWLDPGELNDTNKTSRSEVGPGVSPGDYTDSEGQERYYALSVRFDNTWPATCDLHCIFAQWRQYGSSGTPPIYLFAPYSQAGTAPTDMMGAYVRAGSCDNPADCPQESHQILSKQDFVNARGKWHDIIVRVKWQHDATGELQAWHRLEGNTNFESKFNLSDIATLKRFKDSDGVVKVTPVEPRTGIYRGTRTVEGVLTAPDQLLKLDNDSYCVAETFAAAQSCIDG